MMPDHFAALGLPRQPWFDADTVRAQFQKLASVSHPDAGTGNEQQFVALNEAWQILQSPTTRLRHFLELEYPAEARAVLPPADPELFLQIAEQQQRAAQLAARLAEAKSPIARAVLEPQRKACKDALAALVTEVKERQARLHAELQGSGRSAAELGEILHNLLFLERWFNQLREREIALQ